MGWLPPASDGIVMCQTGGCVGHEKERTATVTKDMMIGVDLAKHVFHLHGATMSGHVLFRKRLSRGQFLRFMERQPSCTVVMEACGGAHHWARELAKLGHEAKLISPGYVKPFVKRQKNDANDAEAIVEAAQRPGMRFVTVKSAEQQAIACLFRARKQLVEHRTALVNALRAHLFEFGFAFPAEAAGLARARRVLEDAGTELPDLVRELCRDQLARIDEASERLAELSRRISALGSSGEQARRLQTMPGLGPVTALAIEAFAPPMESFRSGRDFAAWLGLVPRQHSTGGRQRLGRISKAGQSDIRRLLISGAMSRLNWIGRRAIRPGSWLARMLERKPKMLVAIALANKMARAVWAMIVKGEDYRDPAPIASV